MIAKSSWFLMIAGLVLWLGGVGIMYAEESSSGREMQQSGQAAKEAASDTGRSLKHAYQATKEEMSDAALTTKVKSALWSDSVTKKYTIHVESNQGTVTLNGAVDSPTTAAYAEKVTANVKGVDGVENQLTWPTSLR